MGIYGHTRHMSTQTQQAGFPEYGPGDKLRNLRRQRLGIGQGELARKIGVEKGAVSAWEAGRNAGGITPAVARRVEMVAGIPGTAAWLLGVLPEPPRGGRPHPQAELPVPAAGFEPAAFCSEVKGLRRMGVVPSTEPTPIRRAA